MEIKADKTQKEAKKKTKNIPEKRQRGRPKLAEGEKGAYEFVLFPPAIVQKIDLLSAKNSFMNQQQLYQYVELIEGDEQVREYYWKLATSYAIYNAIANLKEQKLIQKESLKINEIAALMKVNAFNLKSITVGKGHASQCLQFMDSLYRYGVNLMEIKYKPGLVMLAYTHFVQKLTN